MPRKPTPRPIGEHLATLARVTRQIDAVPTATAAEAKQLSAKKQAIVIDPKRAQKIKRALGIAMSELQAEISK
jgi:hypothetical protein